MQTKLGALGSCLADFAADTLSALICIAIGLVIFSRQLYAS